MRIFSCWPQRSCSVLGVLASSRTSTASAVVAVRTRGSAANVAISTTRTRRRVQAFLRCWSCYSHGYCQAFLCNECGHSKWARFEAMVQAKPTYAAVQRIESDEDRDRALAGIEKEAENAHGKYQQILMY